MDLKQKLRMKRAEERIDIEREREAQVSAELIFSREKLMEVQSELAAVQAVNISIGSCCDCGCLDAHTI